MREALDAMRRLWFAVRAVLGGVLAWPMQHAALYAKQVGRWRADEYRRDHHSRWIDRLRQARNLLRLVRALGGFAFWVALKWFGACGKAAAVDRV